MHKLLHGVNGFGQGALSDLKHPLVGGASGATGAVVAEFLVELLPDSFSPDQKMAVGQFGAQISAILTGQDPFTAMQAGTIALEYNCFGQHSLDSELYSQQIEEEKRVLGSIYDYSEERIPILAQSREQSHRMVDTVHDTLDSYPMLKHVVSSPLNPTLFGRSRTIDHFLVDITHPVSKLDVALIFGAFG